MTAPPFGLSAESRAALLQRLSKRRGAEAADAAGADGLHHPVAGEHCDAARRRGIRVDPVIAHAEIGDDFERGQPVVPRRVDPPRERTRRKPADARRHRRKERVGVFLLP